MNTAKQEDSRRAPGRPAKDPSDKKRQKSVYLSEDVIEILSCISDNPSVAIEVLARKNAHLLHMGRNPKDLVIPITK